MAGIIVRVLMSLVAGALALLFLLRKAGGSETIVAQEIKGSITVKADDGNTADDHKKENEKVPVTDEKAGGDSKAKGSVPDWNKVRGEAAARLSPGPPTPPPRQASASSVDIAKSAFTLKKDGKTITPTIDNHFTATLDDDVTAVIKMSAAVVPAGGGPAAASVDVTYTIKPDPTKPGFLKITGSRTDSLKNGGGTSYTEPAAAAKTINRGKYETTLTLSIECTGKGIAQVVVDKADLTLS